MKYYWVYLLYKTFGFTGIVISLIGIGLYAYKQMKNEDSEGND